MQESKKYTLVLIFSFIILLSIIDLFANAVSTIPILGDIAETMSETILESLQALLTGIGFYVVGRK